MSTLQSFVLPHLNRPVSTRPITAGTTEETTVTGIQIDWDAFLGWLREAGMNLVNVAIIIASCLIIGFLLRRVIGRVVKRIVDGAKSKANVDDTQALE